MEEKQSEELWVKVIAHISLFRNLQKVGIRASHLCSLVQNDALYNVNEVRKWKADFQVVIQDLKLLQKNTLEYLRSCEVLTEEEALKLVREENFYSSELVTEVEKWDGD